MYDSKLVKKFVSQGKENADEKCLLIKKHKIQKKIRTALKKMQKNLKRIEANKRQKLHESKQKVQSKF